MAIERMTRKDWFWPLLFLALGVAGAFTAYHHFFQAFPEASIDLRLSKEEVGRRANGFLRGRGLSAEGYRQLTVFDFDDEAKTYLERELGLEEANREMATRVNMWRWKTRWFKPPQKEEMSVWLTTGAVAAAGTGGELVGFEHKVDEKAPGARLSKEEARRVAEVFLRTERRLDLDQYKLVTDEQQARPNRLDYTFTWEKKDFKLKEATLRMEVTVLGDQVGGFREFLKIPEQWTRDYRRLRSRNELLQTIALSAYVLLLGAALAYVVRSAREKRVRWKTAMAYGGVVAFLLAAFVLNDFPLQIQQLPTNAPYETLVLLWIVVAVVNGLFLGVYTALLTAAGEPFYRELLPERLGLNHLFRFSGLRSKEFFRSTLIGYGMAGMHIGLVVLFYVVARKYGAWAPLDVKYNNAVSTALPWIFPLAIAVEAAVTEEFGFRLFAIPLLLRWTKSKWLALVIPAFLWGFLHSGYPQQPAWIRGVEVGLIGIVAGWVFLRFGILATLVWHYTVDAVLIGLFLLRSENLTFRIAGAVVGDAVLLPLVISGVFFLESRGFLADKSLLNAAEAPPKPAAAEEITTVDRIAVPPPRTFEFVPPARMRVLALAGLAALVALALVKPHSVGEKITLQVRAGQAEAAAVQHLRQKGVAVERYVRVTSLDNAISGDSSAEYLREYGDTAAVARIYAGQAPSVFWRTRFFRPLEKEEYLVWIAPDGGSRGEGRQPGCCRVARYQHLRDEKAPGARLEKPEAQARAEAFLAQQGVDISGYRLMEHNLEVREARHDHTLVWESQAKLLGEATHRITVGVIGDEVTGPRHWVKIPEEWQRQHTRLSVLNLLPTVMFLGLGLWAIVLFVRAVARTAVHWRLHLMLGGAGALFQFVRSVNAVPGWKVNYSTSVPWSSFAAQQAAVSILLLSIGTFVGLAALAALAETLLSDRFGSLALWPRGGLDRGRALLEALVAGTAAALVSLAVGTVARLALERIPSPVRGLSSGLPGYPVSSWPGLAMFLDTLTGSLWMTMLIVACAALLLRMSRNKAAPTVALVILAAVLGGASALNGAQFAKQFIALLVSVGVMAALVLVLRFSLGSYLVMGLVGGGLDRIAALWRHPALRPFAVQAAVGLALVLALIVWRARKEARQ